MRFEELAYAVDGLQATVRFHARLTVVCLPEGERAAWVARLLGVLEGTRAGDSTSAVYLGRRGRRIGLNRDDQGGAELIDLATGAEVPYSARHLPLDGRFDWFASIGLTSRAASDLIVVDPDAFTADRKYDPQQLEAKLQTARARLARAEKQHQSALTRSRRRDDLGRQISDLDEQIDQAEAARARRRAEAGAVLAAAGAADDWWRVMGEADDHRRAFGSRTRLNEDSLTRALSRPTEIAEDLESLAKACRAIAERRDELVARLDAGVAAEVDETAAETRRVLIENVEPAFVDTLAALAGACRSFDVIIDAARIGAAVAQLADKHSAFEHEVAALEASLSAGRPLVSAREAEMILLGRAAEAGRDDRRREPLPLVVNDALAPFGANDRRRLLDVVARLTETTQVVYLTDDPDTLAWASGRVASGEITVWRPDGVATVA
jgi:multidrug efflux pump subunit AcrA (membrane-fusion protein)